MPGGKENEQEMKLNQLGRMKDKICTLALHTNLSIYGKTEATDSWCKCAVMTSEGKWPTMLLSGSVVVEHFAFPEDLEGGIACNLKSWGDLVLHGGVHLGQRNGRSALAQLLGCLLVLWSQTLTVSTPEGQSGHRQTRRKCLISLSSCCLKKKKLKSFISAFGLLTDHGA